MGSYHLQNYILPADIRKASIHIPASTYISLLNQEGGGRIPYYIGAAQQEGSGVFSDIISAALPLIKRAAPHILGGISNVIGDVVKGRRPLKKAIVKRGKTAVKKSITAIMKGKGKKIKSSAKKKTSKKKKKNGKKPRSGKKKKPVKKKPPLSPDIFKLF